MKTAGCTPDWGRRVSDFHDGGLTHQQRGAVEAHLATCGACRALLRRYEHLYGDLRSLRGFEGPLRVERPGPAPASPRRVLFPRLQDGASGRSWNGIAAILLMLTLALTIVAGRAVLLAGPLATPAVTPTSALGFDGQPAQRTTPNGTPCANVGNAIAAPYVYSGADGQLWTITNCQNPQLLTRLTFPDYRLGDWSPDHRYLIVFSAANIAVALTNLYLLDAKTGVLETMDLRSNVRGPAISADNALWVSTTELLVQTQGALLHVNVVSGQVTALGITNVARIVGRDQAVYYSVVANGQATVRRHDFGTGTDTLIFNLGAGGDACAAAGGGCLWTAAWDVSPDGTHIAYQYPLPTSVPAPGTSVPAQLVAQSLNGTSPRQPLYSLPLTTAAIQVLYSPDNTRVAGQVAGSPTITVANLIRQNTFTVPGNDTFFWRPDGLAILAEPTTLHQVSPAVISLLLTNQHLALPAATANYVWQP